MLTERKKENENNKKNYKCVIVKFLLIKLKQKKESLNRRFFKIIKIILFLYDIKKKMIKFN